MVKSGSRNQVAALDAAESTMAKEGPSKSGDDPPISLPFYRLFRFADRADVVLMSLGTTGAVINAAVLPVFTVLLGNVLDKIGQGGSEMMAAVLYIVWWLVALTGVAFVASFLEIGLWLTAGVRQANRIRIKYLEAVLRQEVAFFDLKGSTGGLLQGVNDDTYQIQVRASPGAREIRCGW